MGERERETYGCGTSHFSLFAHSLASDGRDDPDEAGLLLVVGKVSGVVRRLESALVGERPDLAKGARIKRKSQRTRTAKKGGQGNSLSN